MRDDSVLLFDQVEDLLPHRGRVRHPELTGVAVVVVLRLLGHRERPRDRDLRPTAGVRAQELEVASLRADGSLRQPVTIWAGVTPQEPLRTLHKKIDQAMLHAPTALPILGRLGGGQIEDRSRDARHRNPFLDGDLVSR